MKPILDACCGGKMFYFDKDDPRVLFQDVRCIETKLKDRGKLRNFSVRPDVQADFTSMPHADNMFRMVVFDPPPLEIHGLKERGSELADGEVRLVARSWMAGYPAQGICRVLSCIAAWRFPYLQVERDRHQSFRGAETDRRKTHLRTHQRQTCEHPLDMFYETRVKY